MNKEILEKLDDEDWEFYSDLPSLNRYRKMSHKTVWVNGSFDVLHIGHIRMLKHAASLGEVIVGIDTDRRISELKGPKRPFNKLEDRKEMLESFHFVSRVVVFDTTQELRQKIEEVHPDFLVVGAEYQERGVVGAEHAKEVVFFQRIPEYSTSNILKHEA